MIAPDKYIEGSVDYGYDLHPSHPLYYSNPTKDYYLVRNSVDGFTDPVRSRTIEEAIATAKTLGIDKYAIVFIKGYGRKEYIKKNDRKELGIF